MFSISNHELEIKPTIGNTIKCRNCGEMHNVEYGDRVLKDGTKEKSTLLAYVKCPQNDVCYLVGIEGKEI